MENIFFNGFLLSPFEMIEFVDHFSSEFVKVHFDTGNIMEYQFPEHWIPLLGKRIKNVHLKEFTKKGTDHSLEAFRPLLDGTTNWPAVLDAFDKVGYDGYLTFEYFHPYQHFPEALIYQTADSLDRMLGIKSLALSSGRRDHRDGSSHATSGTHRSHLHTVGATTVLSTSHTWGRSTRCCGTASVWMDCTFAAAPEKAFH